ncbi:MAG: putative Ig domain-containing protein [Planctomycetes bacterium]|nr:putative Ig domain-containing protein [Planctomycetota bacterium]
MRLDRCSRSNFLSFAFLSLTFLLAACAPPHDSNNTGAGGDQFSDSVSGTQKLAIITGSTLPQGAEGVFYSIGIRARGGSSAGYTWTITAGGLPGGLSLADGTPEATLEGTPSDTGTFDFTLMVTDSEFHTASKGFTLVVQGTPALAITTVSLPDGDQGTAYDEDITASGGTGVGYTWTVSAGALPGGLSLANGTPSATLSGTPNAPGTFSFTLQVTDSGSNTDTQAYTVDIASSGVLTITTTTLADGTRDVVYSVNVTATGGSGAGYTWLVTVGSLPTGLTLAGTGTPTTTISGTPTVTGSYSFTVEVTDSLSNTDTQALTIDINDPVLTITTTTLAGGTQDVAYSENITAVDGTGTGYTWSVTAGSLPGGLTLTDGTPSATLDGTPTAFGTFNFTVQVTDSGSNVDTQALQIIIAPPPLVITTTTLPDGDVGTPYSELITATGGTGAGYTFTVTVGAQPSGLTLSSATPSGTLAGTPNAAATYNFTVTVTDSGSGIDTQAFTIVIADLTIVTTALPDGSQNVAYSQPIFAAGGTGAGYVFTLSSGTLPTGLSLGNGTPSGTLSGTPTATGVFTFTVLVTDSGSNTDTQAFTVNINLTELQIITTSLPDGVIGTAYSELVTATGGTDAGYTWTVSSGALPTGLAEADGTPSNTISGNPTTQNYYTFTMRVQDSGGNVATRFFQVRINAALTIPAFTMPAAQVGEPYSQPVISNGGSGSGYVWTLDSGTIPPGLNFTPTTGQFTAIAGTPTTTVGSPFTFTMRITDGAANTATRAFTITVESDLTITTLTLPGGTAGTAYNQNVTASGGSGAGYAWTAPTVMGTLPTGLTLAGTGTPTTTLSGTPTGSGTFTFWIRVTDNATGTAQRAYTITIAAAGGSLEITTTSPLPAATIGVAYTTNIVSTGGAGAHTWSIYVGSALPDGMTLGSGATTVALAGTPTTTGVYTFTVQVSAATGPQRATKTFSLTINGPTGVPVVTTTSLPSGRVGVAYSGGFLTGAYGTLPYSWAIIGALPAGITLGNTSPVGTLTGTPTASGTFNITIQLTDNTAQVATRAVSIVIDPAVGPLTITTLTLPDGKVGQQYGTRIDAVGGTGLGYTWTVQPVGSLPGGLDIYSGTPYGALGGVPFVSGTFSFTVKVTDSGANTDTQDLTIQIGPSGVPLDVITDFLPYGVRGTAYTTPITGTGGSGSGYTWIVESGYLPPGLTLTSGTPSATLAGTPELHGMFYFCIKLTDSDGYQTRRVYRLPIGPSGSTLNVKVPDPAPPMIQNVAWSATVYATGGSGTYPTWQLTGTIPAGFSITGAGASATINGTATSGGTRTFNIQVTDSLAATATAVLVVTPVSGGTSVGFFLNLTTNILPSAFRGRPYNFGSAAASGSGTGYTWSHVGGLLPPGLHLVPRGAFLYLQGTPLATGTFTFSVEVEDSLGATATGTMILTVADIVLHYGAPVNNRAVFIADKSGSMGGANTARYNTLKQELVTNILAMEPTDQFDIVPYSSAVVMMWGELRYATPANKAEALAFVEGSGIFPNGSTATYPALNFVLNRYPTNLLSLFLITDGAPTVGGTDVEIVRDTPAWFANYPSCDFTAVGVRAIGTFEQFLMQLTAELQGLYISR